MKIAIAALLAGAALSLAACHSKANEETANVAVDNGADLNAAGSEAFDNGETADNSVLDNAEAVNVSEAGSNAN